LVIARPHTLPEEIARLPHGLGEIVDAGETTTVRQAPESVQLEIDRRRQTGCVDAAELVVVVRELRELEPGALRLLAAIASSGPGRSGTRGRACRRTGGPGWTGRADGGATSPAARERAGADRRAAPGGRQRLDIHLDRLAPAAAAPRRPDPRVLLRGGDGLVR